MTIKAVFFDIDGTLLNDRKSVPKTTQKAIKHLKKQGIIVGLATGRGPSFVNPLMENLALDVAITYNGQYIFTRDQILYQNQLPKSVIYRVIRLASQRRRDISLGTASGLVGSHIIHMGTSRLGQLLSTLVPKRFAKSISQGMKQIIRRIKPQNSANLLTIMREPIFQIVLMASPSETQQLLDHFPSLTLTRSNPYSVDMISLGQSKYQGIRRVADHFGFTLDEVMAFGDSDNDLEMLTQVGVGVAMENSSPQVKKAAHFTTLSNNHHGIPHALAHFGLLPIRAEDSFISNDDNFNKVKAFHQLVDGQTQEHPTAYKPEAISHRVSFKAEKLVECLYASSHNDQTTFDLALRELHLAIDKAAKTVQETPSRDPLLEEVDALTDLLYFTYGSFALMGVDPKPIFDTVHEANLKKISPDGIPHFDPITHKLLKPENWEKDYAPGAAIKRELNRQIQKAKQKQTNW